MSTRRWFLLTAGCLLCTATGCFSARAPERIDVRVGNSSRPEPVDSARVPDPQTLEQARAELRKAYADIRWLERKVARLEEDKQEYKRERDECEDRLERYEDD